MNDPHRTTHEYPSTTQKAYFIETIEDLCFEKKISCRFQASCENAHIFFFQKLFIRLLKIPYFSSKKDMKRVRFYKFITHLQKKPLRLSNMGNLYFIREKNY